MPAHALFPLPGACHLQEGGVSSHALPQHGEQVNLRGQMATAAPVARSAHRALTFTSQMLQCTPYGCSPY